RCRLDWDARMVAGSNILPGLRMELGSRTARSWRMMCIWASPGNLGRKDFLARPTSCLGPVVWILSKAELLANFFGGERRFAFVAGTGFEQVKVVVQVLQLLAQGTDLFEHRFLLPFQNRFLWR